MRTSIRLFTALLLILGLTACGGPATDGAGPTAQTPADATTTDPLADLVVDGRPTGGSSITAAKQNVQSGQAITIHGRVGGKRQPFITGRAAMLVADPEAIVACDAKPDDHCKYPWDFCCEPADAIAAATALVQVTDAEGQALAQSLEGVGGLSPGDHVVVEGEVSAAAGGNLVINANRIHRTPHATTH